MENKSELFKQVAKSVDFWVYSNTSMCARDREKLIKFIESLDKPVEFKMKDGTIVKTGVRSDCKDYVEIKPKILSGKALAHKQKTIDDLFDRIKEGWRSTIKEAHSKLAVKDEH